MITISVCMLVKNNEKTLASLLSTINQFSEEIIVVDLGSSDKTIEIASQYTPIVRSFSFQDDFAAARNFSFSLASKDYIMWLDPDDMIDANDIQKILELKQTADKNMDVYMFNYDANFDSYGNCTQTFYREGLIRREAGLLWEDPVHEYIQVLGNIDTKDIHIKNIGEYDPSDTTVLDIYRKLEERGQAFSPRSVYYYAKELSFHDMNDKAIDKYNEFLETEGWIEDKIAACFELSFCYEKSKNLPGMLASLLRSFEYSIPRAEICCRIGEYFITMQLYEEAIYWFEAALSLKMPDIWGYVQIDYYGYIPHLWLCVLYYQLEDIEKAKYHNDCAAKIKPDDVSVLYNASLLIDL